MENPHMWILPGVGARGAAHELNIEKMAGEWSHVTCDEAYNIYSLSVSYIANC